MKFEFLDIQPQGPWKDDGKNWASWIWQLQNGLKTQDDFSKWFELSSDEIKGFEGSKGVFQIQTTPYYAQLSERTNSLDPIRKMQMPHAQELIEGSQEQFDPLAETKHSVTPRLVHRYSDRVLFLVTDICSMYCRFCTRKRFTGQSQAVPSVNEYNDSLNYIRSHPGIREVILSGGDAFTLSDTKLEKVLSDLRKIEHIEIIRIGSRMPVVNPFRITDGLGKLLRKYAPLFVMTHFNHPREITLQSKSALENLVDNGVPVMNQMVLLNGVNNHPAIVQALSRRLLFLRVKPYYMLQCDPSEGTDHFRTSVQESEEIQKELWGHFSGLAMPNLIVDLPNGGGKVGVTPNYEMSRSEDSVKYKGWDGVEIEYKRPVKNSEKPSDLDQYLNEWNSIKRK